MHTALYGVSSILNIPSFLARLRDAIVVEVVLLVVIIRLIVVIIDDLVPGPTHVPVHLHLHHISQRNPVNEKISLARAKQAKKT